MELLITRPEREVISMMKRGHYLVRSEDGEGLTTNTGGNCKISYPVKAGTIESLESVGLIEVSINGNKWLLTDEGRKIFLPQS